MSQSAIPQAACPLTELLETASCLGGECRAQRTGPPPLLSFHPFFSSLLPIWSFFPLLLHLMLLRACKLLSPPSLSSFSLQSRRYNGNFSCCSSASGLPLLALTLLSPLSPLPSLLFPDRRPLGIPPLHSKHLLFSSSYSPLCVPLPSAHTLCPCPLLFPSPAAQLHCKG